MAVQETRDDETANEVRLVGTVSGGPVQRELPSGDTLVSFLVVVPRQGAARARAAVDALECVAWNARCRRSAASWRAGDLVEVTGTLRRRFFSAGAARVSRTEVEVARARLVRRATSG
jgi:single-strand DNA-binding protein